MARRIRRALRLAAVVVVALGTVGCSSGSTLPSLTPSEPAASVTAGNLVAPDLVGKTAGQAKATLTGLGVVSVSTNRQTDASAKPGTVIAQVPIAGQVITTGTGFDLTVARRAAAASPASDIARMSGAAIRQPN
jgi:beta-lactam-binding protein with PASTA domain